MVSVERAYYHKYDVNFRIFSGFMFYIDEYVFCFIPSNKPRDSHFSGHARQYAHSISEDVSRPPTISTDHGSGLASTNMNTVCCQPISSYISNKFRPLNI